MPNSTLHFFYSKKKQYLSLVVLVFLCFSFSNKASAQASSIKENVSFVWAGAQNNRDDSATLESIDIDGKIYNSFVVPSSYEMTRLGPKGDDENHILLNGNTVLDNSGSASWDSNALAAFQSLNLNHYFECNGNGREICGDYGALTTTDAQIQSISYDPGIPSNKDGILAVTERNANNCLHISIYGTPVGGGSDQLLGQTYIYPGAASGGPQSNIPPTTSDYWLTERVNDNNGTIGIALFELSQLAPIGSIIKEIQFTAATTDVGDGKFFLMQTYAVDDIFESEFNETFNGDVAANDNVPNNSSYSYFTSTNPLNGSVTVNTDGTFNYTPDPGYVGTDIFEIQVCLPAPNQSECDTSTVTLTIKPDNLPTANDDSYTVNEDIVDNIFNVLNNDDFGLDGPKENSALSIVTDPSNGAASVSDNGTPTNSSDDYIIYTPSPYYNGTDSLVYEITDANGTTASATVTITVNPDTSKLIDILTKNISVNEDVGTATITVQIQGNYQVGPTINYTTIDNTASAGSDYTTTNSNHTFTGNNNETFSFNVPITDDLVIEASEIIDIEVTTNSYSSPLTLNTTIEITDNDGGAGTGISVFDFTVNENAGTATFDVSLNADVQEGFTVDFAIADGSAVATNDYSVASTNGTLTFAGANGETKSITVTILDDTIIEGTEDLNITLSGLSTNLINIVDATAVGAINDNDGGTGTGINFVSTNVTVTEGVGVTATFAMSLTGDFQNAFDVAFETVFDTATGTDFVAQTDNISFAGNDGEVQNIVVTILNDNIIEPTEGYFVNLTSTTNPLVNINTPQATGTILDDDLVPGTGIQFDNTSVIVTEGADAFARFTVTLTGAITENVTVGYTTNEGTALDGSDMNIQSGTITFTPTVTSFDIDVPIIDDTIIEPTENFTVVLSNVQSNIGIGFIDGNSTNTANGIINDDDNNGSEGLSIVRTNVVVTEGTGVTATFDVTLTGDFASGFDVDFGTAFGTATATDFTPITNGTISFTGNDGEVQQITVDILDDSIIEPQEAYTVTLNSVTNPLVPINDANANGIINDDDGNGLEGLSIVRTNVVVTEGTGVTATFDVTLTGDFASGFDVDFGTAFGTATATDFTPITNGTISFTGNDGEVQQITVDILDDSIIETQEAYTVTLNSVTNTLVPINDDTANGIINDDDLVPGTGIQFDNTNVIVTEGADSFARFTVTLTGAITENVTVDYVTNDGTALDTSDITGQSGTITFTPTVSSFNIDVPIVDDTIIEATEEFTAVLSNIQSNLGIGFVDGNPTNTATGTINDNDGDASLGVQFDVASINVNEDAGTVSLDVILNVDVQDEFTVEYATTDGTATDALDYTGVAMGTQNLTFGGTNPNTQTIVIPIIDDIIIEDTEDFTVVLSNISTTLVNILADDTATVNIMDNDGNEGWPTDMTIEACDKIPPAATITTTSTCAINVILNEEITGQDDACATEYTITRTWTITDCVGNVREHIQVITIVDTVAPTFVEALPQDMTVACNEVPDADILTAIDSCEPNIEVTFEEVITNDANCSTGYTVTRTWNANDCAGNSVSHTQIITIPLTGPIMASPYEEEITILCGDMIPEVPELTFTGGCGDYNVEFTEETQIASDSDDFMIIRTWDVMDACGNTASFEQIIFILQPQLEEVTIDICVEEDAIDLINYLPEGFDANGEFMVLEGNAILNGSMFDPLNHQPGEYKIAYSSTGRECKYFVDFTIIVNTDCVPCGRDEIEVSKAITPNGDGINDTFEIKGVEFCQFTFDVMLFNRWGNKVADVINYQNDWGGESPNGSFGSSGMLPSGTYYYIINATDTETGKTLEPLNGYIYIGSN